MAAMTTTSASAGLLPAVSSVCLKEESLSVASSFTPLMSTQAGIFGNSLRQRSRNASRKAGSQNHGALQVAANTSASSDSEKARLEAMVEENARLKARLAELEGALSLAIQGGGAPGSPAVAADVELEGALPLAMQGGGAPGSPAVAADVELEGALPLAMQGGGAPGSPAVAADLATAAAPASSSVEVIEEAVGTAQKRQAVPATAAQQIIWPSPQEEPPFWMRWPTSEGYVAAAGVTSNGSTGDGVVGERDSERIHIVHVTAEMAPLAKVGGLGDVVTGLGRACLARGHMVEVMLPFYECLDTKQIANLQLKRSFGSYFKGDWVGVEAFSGEISDVPVVLLKPENHFFRGGRIYGGSYNELEAYLFFSRASLEFLQVTGAQPDILHVHEWHTAAVALLYWDMYHQLNLQKPRLILTIHNMEHHGECRWEQLDMCGLDGQSYLDTEKAMDDRTMGHSTTLRSRLCLLHLHSKYSCCSSPYSHSSVPASPICPPTLPTRPWMTAQWGTTLSSLSCHILCRHTPLTLPLTITTFTAHQAMDDRTVGHNPERLSMLKGGIVYSNIVTYFGVLNGIDTEMWDPQTDPHLPAHFSPTSLAGKMLCKHYVQRGLGLTPEITPEAAEKLAADVSAGPVADSALTQLVTGERSPLVVCVTRLVAQKGIHLIRHAIYQTHKYGGQFILLGSSPDGRVQGDFVKIAEEVPVVRRTGGLADTVFDVDDGGNKEKANGEAVRPSRQVLYSSLLSLLLRLACSFVFDGIGPEWWQQLTSTVMSIDNSWNKAAKEYISLYDSIRAPPAPTRSSTHCPCAAPRRPPSKASQRHARPMRPSLFTHHPPSATPFKSSACFRAQACSAQQQGGAAQPGAMLAGFEYPEHVCGAAWRDEYAQLHARIRAASRDAWRARQPPATPPPPAAPPPQPADPLRRHLADGSPPAVEPAGAAAVRFLTYDWYGSCGGLGDYLIGLVSLFPAALLDRRALVVAQPCMHAAFRSPHIDTALSPDVPMGGRLLLRAATPVDATATARDATATVRDGDGGGDDVEWHAPPCERLEGNLGAAAEVRADSNSNSSSGGGGGGGVPCLDLLRHTFEVEALQQLSALSNYRVRYNKGMLITTLLRDQGPWAAALRHLGFKVAYGFGCILRFLFRGVAAVGGDGEAGVGGGRGGRAWGEGVGGGRGGRAWGEGVVRVAVHVRVPDREVWQNDGMTAQNMTEQQLENLLGKANSTLQCAQVPWGMTVQNMTEQQLDDLLGKASSTLHFPQVLPTPPSSLPFPPSSLPFPPSSLPFPPSSLPFPPSSLPFPPSSLPFPPSSLPFPPSSLPFPPSSLPLSPTSLPVPIARGGGVLVPASLNPRLSRHLFPSLHPLSFLVRSCPASHLLFASCTAPPSCACAALPLVHASPRALPLGTCAMLGLRTCQVVATDFIPWHSAQATQHEQHTDLESSSSLAERDAAQRGLQHFRETVAEWALMASSHTFIIPASGFSRTAALYALRPLDIYVPPPLNPPKAAENPQKQPPPSACDPEKPAAIDRFGVTWRGI
ncbi:unnamed protein product [Closterium sp. NIES-64]|nr:unnamed protein product [Closterium sp. NIES-64]